MIEILIPGLIHASDFVKDGEYFFDLWYFRGCFVSIPCLICLGLFIFLIIILVLLLKELMRESTKKCPCCGERIPADAAWCKFCKSDLTEGFAPGSGKKTRRDMGKPCPECDRGMLYIEEYDRWYCGSCQEYK